MTIGVIRTTHTQITPMTLRWQGWSDSLTSNPHIYIYSIRTLIMSIDWAYTESDGLYAKMTFSKDIGDLDCWGDWKVGMGSCPKNQLMLDIYAQFRLPVDVMCFQLWKAWGRLSGWVDISKSESQAGVWNNLGMVSPARSLSYRVNIPWFGGKATSVPGEIIFIFINIYITGT